MASPFATPQNERSFSSVVDGVVSETGRPDNFLTIIQYANATVRECQALGLFARDRIEDQLTADASPFIYTRPPYFRSLGAVNYSCGVYPKLRIPGKQQYNELYYYYAADDYYVFVGVGVGQPVNILSYFWRQPLLYYGRLGVNTDSFPGSPYDIRKAYFDIEQSKWQYLNNTNDGYVDTTGDTDTDALYRKLSSNWLIEDWYDMIGHGTKAKVFGQFNDTDRANRAYAAYKASQKLLSNTVGTEAEFSAQ